MKRGTTACGALESDMIGSRKVNHFPLFRGFYSMCILVCPLPGVAQGAPQSAEVIPELEQALSDFDQAQSIQTEQPERARRLFRLAAQRFDSIVAAGVTNGRLEYNLANCHLQAGDVGQAVLHYRRAQRSIPNDPLVANNLAEARSRCLTAIQPTRRSTFLRSVFFWHYQTSLAARAQAALILYMAVWALLIVRNLAPRRAVTASVILCVVLASAAAGSLAATRWSDRNAPCGVVTAMDVMVYKGPGAEYQRQFEQPLQPGVEFTHRERRGGWWRIELADGKSGWIDGGQAELVAGGNS